MDKSLVMQTSAALKFSKLSIKPYLNGSSNMGLGTYNMVIHERIWHTDQVICKVDGKTKTYTTGLNESSPEVQNLKYISEEQFEAKVIEIRRLVAKAERGLAANYELDPEVKEIEKDKDFWSKVKTFRSVVPDVFDNNGIRQSTYWDNLTIKLNNEGVLMNEDSVRDQLIVTVIEAGGFVMVAPSYEECVNTQKYKFYLDKKQDTSANEVIPDKIRDKAGAKLFTIREQDSNKLFYITKLISNDSLYFKDGKNSTPLDTMYKECTLFLNGKGREQSKIKACEEFIRYTDMKLEELKIRAVLKDALLNKFVVINDNSLMYLKTQTIIGSNEEDAVLYLKNPGNAKVVFSALLTEVEKQWK